MRLTPCCLVLLLACGDDGPPILGGDSGTGTDAGLPTACDVPGASERLTCGRCGEQTRFCTVDGEWEYGPCTDESGVCSPGETDMVACGGCGTQLSVCSASCEWESTGECMSSGECEPGERQRTSMGCDAGETRELVCTDACMFEEAMECENDECDEPGSVESVSCGRCGTRERFCTSANVWEYGPCGGEGVCDPGTTDTVACGNCGSQTSRCDTSCQWNPTGECRDEGECAPGSSRTTSAGCSAGEQRIETCSESCDYVPGECIGGTPGLGEACPAGVCDGELVCSEETSTSICREDCTGSGTCGGTRTCIAERLCSDSCTLFTHAGCPAGSKCDLLAAGTIFFEPEIKICSGVGTGGTGTPCTANWQCRRNFVCLLDEGSESGSCTAVCDDAHPCVTGTCSGTGMAGYCM